MQVTEKELKQLSRKVKKQNLESDLGIDTAKVIASLEKRIEKLEKRLQGQDVVIQKLWAWKITREYTEKGE